MSETDKRIIYHPLFDCDVREAAGWYDRRSPGLGNAFVAAIRDTVDAVIADPERFASLEARVRYRRANRFPYVVLFDVIGDTLYMLGVLHTARSIEKWRERSNEIGR